MYITESQTVADGKGMIFDEVSYGKINSWLFPKIILELFNERNSFFSERAESEFFKTIEQLHNEQRKCEQLQSAQKEQVQRLQVLAIA